MGHLPWRKKGTRLGCRRGWIGILGLAAFAIVGYFALYGWLRVTGQIDLAFYEGSSYEVAVVFEGNA